MTEIWRLKCRHQTQNTKLFVSLVLIAMGGIEIKAIVLILMFAHGTCTSTHVAVKELFAI